MLHHWNLKTYFFSSLNRVLLYLLTLAVVLNVGEGLEVG